MLEPPVVAAVQGSAVHVCKPRAAVAEMVYPVLHAEQSTVLSVSHFVSLVGPVATVGIPFGQVHVLASHVGLVK